jgi:ABC-type branched-subunit amino acid transport system substrate-binding protein
LILAICLCVLVGCDDDTTGETTLVIIGLLTPLTGDLAAWGQEFQNAANLAVQEINAGGGTASGRQFDLEVEDTQTTAEASEAAAQRLVDLGAVAIVGAAGSSNSLAAVKVTGPAKIPQISPSSTSTNLNKVDSEDPSGEAHPYFFRTTPSDKLQQVALGGLAAGQFNSTDVQVTCERLAVINLNNDYGRPFGEGVANQYRALTQSAGTGEVVAEIDYPLDLPSYPDQVAELTAATPDCIVMISYGQTGGYIVRDWYSSNPDSTVQWLLGDGNQDKSFFEALTAHREDFLGTAPAGDPNRTQLQSFDTAYQSNFLAPRATPFSPMVYDATALIALAIIHADSTDGAQIRESLFDVSGFETGDYNTGPSDLSNARGRLLQDQGINYEGGAGPVDFQDNGDIIGGFEIWRWDDDSAGFQSVANISASDLENL